MLAVTARALKPEEKVASDKLTFSDGEWIEAAGDVKDDTFQSTVTPSPKNGVQVETGSSDYIL